MDKTYQFYWVKLILLPFEFPITSSIELQDLMNRLEQRLIHARQIKKTNLINKINEDVLLLKEKDIHVYEMVTTKVTPLLSQETNSFQLKVQLNALVHIHTFVEDFMTIMKAAST